MDKVIITFIFFTGEKRLYLLNSKILNIPGDDNIGAALLCTGVIGVLVPVMGVTLFLLGVVGGV